MLPCFSDWSVCPSVFLCAHLSHQPIKDPLLNWPSCVVPSTLLLPSSKKSILPNVKVRIGYIATFHLTKPRKAKFFVLCDVIVLVLGSRGNLKLITLGSERVENICGVIVEHSRNLVCAV